MEIYFVKHWKHTICFVLEFIDWGMHIKVHLANALNATWSQTHPMSLSLCPQTWSSVWCNLTTTLASPEPASLIPPILPTPPAKRAHQCTPSRQQQTDRTAARPGTPGKNRSMFKKIDFDMCTHPYPVWNLHLPPIPPCWCFPVFPMEFFFFVHIFYIAMTVCMWVSFLFHHHKTLKHNSNKADGPKVIYDAKEGKNPKPTGMPKA